MKIKKVVVLGYASEGLLVPGWKEETTGKCYWCGRGEEEIRLRPFWMRWGKKEVVNLACLKCYSKSISVGEGGKHGQDYV